MVALLFAATTSFVSCKDNVDDELVPVYAKLAQQKSELEAQITALQLQLNNLDLDGWRDQVNANTVAIQNLQNKLDLMQSQLDTINNQISTLSASVDTIQAELDDLESAVAIIELAILDLQEQINELNERVDEMTKMITGIQINQTICNPVGTINLPGGLLRLNALAAFFGSNETGVEHFPNTDEDAIVLGEALTADEIAPAYAADQEYNFDPNTYITQDEGNAGLLFFTVNSLDPESFDISEYTLSVQNSLGRTAPITFSEVKPSSYLIQPGIYHSGYVDSDPDLNNDPTYFQARATIARKDLEAARFDLSKFFDLQQAQSDIEAAVKEIKAAKGENAKVKAIAKTVTEFLAKIFSGNMSGDNKNITNPSWSAQKLVLSKEIDGRTVKRQADDFDLAVSAVAPLSYNSFWEIEGVWADKFSLDYIERIVSKIAKRIKEELPSIKLGSIKVKIPASWDVDENPYILVGGDDAKLDDLTTWTKIEIEGEFIETLRQAIKDGMTEIDLAEMIQNLADDALGTSVDNIASRFNSYIEKFGNKIVSMLNHHMITRAVTPMVLFNSANGIKRLVTGTTVNSGVMQINITSPTSELLVPAYAKYVALFKADGSCVQAKVYGGSEQRVDLNLAQAGEYKLIVSCMDYYGFVVNKKIDITVK
jgi:predicted nuclease with TOPRIM domain